MIKLALLCVVLGSGVEPYRAPTPKKKYSGYVVPTLHNAGDDIQYDIVMEDFEHYGDEYQNFRDVQWITVWVRKEAKNGMGYKEFAGIVVYSYIYGNDFYTGDILEKYRVQCLYRHGKPEIFENCTLDEGVRYVGEKFKGEKDGQ